MGVAIGCAGMFCADALRHWSLPSFYYRITVENGTSHDYIAVRLIQLCDVMERGRFTKETHAVVRRGAKEELALGGERESPETVFLIVATSCKENGASHNIPEKEILVRALRYAHMRDYLGVPLKLRQEDFCPLSDTLRFWDKGSSSKGFQS